MELAKEERAEFQSAIDLLIHQWKKLDTHLKDCLEVKDDPKEVILGSTSQEREEKDEFALTMRELREKEDEILKEARDLELMELESQKEFEEKEKMLEQRRLRLDSQEHALAEREMKQQSELKGMRRRKAELDLGKKKLANHEEALEIKKMMIEMKMQDVAAGSSRSKPTEEPDLMSRAKIEGNQRKRCKDASGSARNADITKVKGGDGLAFLLSITRTHEAKGEMNVPKHFTGTFDTSGKKYVILSTEKGDFRLDVRNYHRSDRGPKSHASLIVNFCNGWRNFYRENHLSVGTMCLFELKENTVNGDDSGFSMKVSVLER